MSRPLRDHLHRLCLTSHTPLKPIKVDQRFQCKCVQSRQTLSSTAKHKMKEWQVYHTTHMTVHKTFNTGKIHAKFWNSSKRLIEPQLACKHYLFSPFQSLSNINWLCQISHMSVMRDVSLIPSTKHVFRLVSWLLKPTVYSGGAFSIPSIHTLLPLNPYKLEIIFDYKRAKKNQRSEDRALVSPSIILKTRFI
jgi:hypothetical protein